MSDDIFYPLLIVAISVLFSGFFSGMEIAFVSSNRVRAEIDAKKGGIINRILALFYGNSEMFISTMLIGNNVVNVVFSMSMSMLLAKPLQAWLGDSQVLNLLLVTLIGTAILLLFGEFVPKALFRINPNQSLRMMSLPLLLCYLLFYPVSKFTELLSRGIMRLLGIKAGKVRSHTISVEELDAYLQDNIDRHEDNNREVEREVKYFENALDFSDTRLRDCMIPRNEIVAVDIAATTRDQLVQLFTRSGLSKLVVYHDDIDNVMGFIGVSELFEPDKNWKDQIKPVIFAPETMLAKVMMQNLLHKRRSMAIVVDEFGGTAGLVTLEDLVEEIFGDIEDEHDHKRLTAREVEPGVWELSGRAEIEVVNEKFHLDLPENDDYQTIAGLLINELEAIPTEGQQLTIPGYRLTALKVQAARILLVKVEQIPATPQEE